jgi:hypothetical protein
MSAEVMPHVGVGRCDGHHRNDRIALGTLVAIGRRGFNEQIIGANEQVFGQNGLSRLIARMRASLAGLDEGTFTESHELVPKAMIERLLSQEEAKRLLAKIG